VPAENATTSPAETGSAPGAQQDAPTVIEVRGLEKAFRIPTHRVDSLKERIVRPFAARDYRELRALDKISFDVGKGEFFGIVGRNGSGKSTLLKLLASIYRADAGSIRMAGRLAPFIELGVGFNAELTARENILLNGVMMGLTPGETRERVDDVLDFAELRDFADLKLKNYSSGMLVRLAFSVMLQADADILLIDEVLAVGDAAFQQKCADAFHRLKAEGRTIVLVTHEMTTVEKYCHRAMLIDGGKIREIGDPAEIGRQYLRLNFQPASDLGQEAAPATAEGARLLAAWIENGAGERVSAVERGEGLRLRTELEITRKASGLGVGFIISNADGVGVFEFGTELKGRDGGYELGAGERLTVSAELANPLAPGHYYVHCGVHQNQPAVEEEVSLYSHAAADFVVFGTVNTGGILALDHEIEAVVESEQEGAR
jgi:ABC-type polysaccharide/polyol phosphate transport system ATPase subunit